MLAAHGINMLNGIRLRIRKEFALEFDFAWNSNSMAIRIGMDFEFEFDFEWNSNSDSH
jgi:hypothetical protein